jgi:uncharacterized repeat protein (TIGR01451 family)
LTYTLTVVNEHPFAAQHDLILTDTIPLHTSFLTATQPYTLTGDLISWQIPLLAAGESWQMELVVGMPITFTGVLVNDSYGVRSREMDVVPGTPVETQVYMLGLEKIVSAETIAPGFPLTYTLTVTNLNPDGLTNGVILTDSLPVGAQFVSASGSYTVTDGVVIWQLGDLAPGEAVQVELVIQVNEDWRGWLVNENYAVWSLQVTQPVIIHRSLPGWRTIITSCCHCW